MAAIKDGDRVRIITREHTEKEIEQMTYFPHYGGLEGQVVRGFADGDVAVNVERDSLVTDVRKTYEHIEKRVKDKFVASISEEGRKRLTKEELDVKLNYVVLVKQDDLELAKGKAPAPKEAPKPEAKRKTSKELEEEEAAYLREREQQK